MSTGPERWSKADSTTPSHSFASPTNAARPDRPGAATSSSPSPRDSSPPASATNSTVSSRPSPPTSPGSATHRCRHTDLHYLRALLARADGDLDGAWNHAHHALDVAEPAHLHLRAIDDLHLLGVLAHQRGQTATAARLLGAVTAERARIGYVARELPDGDTVDAIEADLRMSEPVAWAEGEALAFADAIEYARRSRGERSRPTVGWASLTPTEQRVAAVVAEGHSNDEVARRLLMSVATVKTHLTHIYAKTGVTSRTGLAASLRRL